MPKLLNKMTYHVPISNAPNTTYSCFHKSKSYAGPYTIFNQQLDYFVLKIIFSFFFFLSFFLSFFDRLIFLLSLSHLFHTQNLSGSSSVNISGISPAQVLQIILSKHQFYCESYLGFSNFILLYCHINYYFEVIKNSQKSITWKHR